MNKRIAALCAAAALSWNAWSIPGQAASFAAVQPYISDYKIGFTNGQTLVTKAVYDEFYPAGAYYTVTKNGKKGVIEAATGKEVTPPIWDDVEIPERKNVAIVRSGGWFQYIDLPKRSVSKSKFAGGHVFSLSSAYPSVIMMKGKSSMLLDPSGRVLLPAFAGTIEFADLVKPGTGGDEQAIRYLVTTDAAKLTVYDPNTLKPIFSLPKAALAPTDGNKLSYFKVISGGKYGLVDVSGRYVLPPQYTSIQPLTNGFIRVQNQQGAGLWKDGRLLAEPQYADVRIEHDMPDGFVTIKGESETYHSLSAGSSFSLKKGARYLHGGYILGQDPVTSRYGVKHISGETAVPFVYPRLEGVPAMWLLVREDGKKGILRAAWGQPVQPPDAWFDSVTTLGGYDLVSVMEGSKVGLYSQQKGLVVPPEAGTVIRYDPKSSRIVVQGPNGTEQGYRMDGTPEEAGQPKQTTPLTAALSTRFVPGEGVAIIRTADGAVVGKPYRQVYLEAGGRIVVALLGERADLYTPEGTLLTTDVKIAAMPADKDWPPVTIFPAGNSYYAAGAGEGKTAQALVRITEGKLELLTPYQYRRIAAQPWGERQLVSFQKLDGSYELWIQMNGETLAKRENVQAFRMEETRTALLIQQAGGWDAYDADLKPLTDGSYGSIDALSTYSGEKIMTYRDRKTGLLGVLGQDWRPATPPVYDSIKPFDQVFPQLAFERKPAPFVFTKKEKFGYLSQTGAELFQTALLTKRPTVTYQPLTAQPFPAYRELLRMDPLRLVDFGKPYGWASGQSSEANFFANLALYLQLPPAAGKQEVLAELTERGVLKADPLRTELTPPDWFALMHFVVTGSSGQALTAQQLEEWAMKRDLVRQYGHPINVDIYADYHQLFFRELLRAQAGSGLYKAKPLSLATLDEYQRNMLGALIKVNGRELMSLPVPLPAAELDRHLQVLIQQYNKQAAALLQAAVKQL